MAKRMPGRLVALSASAVATIYVAGFLSTQPAAQTVAAEAASSPTSVLTAPTASSTSAPTVVVGASTATAQPTATAAGTPVAPTSTSTSTSASSTSTYADGTYSATGTSQLGNVTVSVTISNDKISNVQITKVTTKFPVSRIASLPAAVVQSQSANVNVISGATYSSQAFKQAVQQTLTQAQAARSAQQ